jgi:hypothetical protein
MPEMWVDVDQRGSIERINPLDYQPVPVTVQEFNHANPDWVGTIGGSGCKHTMFRL